MSKHTPGPWRVNFTHSENGVLVSIGIHSSDGPVPATFDNAYLMAAAPQMLEALKNLAQEVNAGVNNGWLRKQDGYKQALAAIAAAEGRGHEVKI
ncbi:MAG: hypothetical protein FGM22_07245 [Burkholderiaceae bacterium]|nr:hypothetical protein [Burkholderiaceae bacterium]